MCNKDEPSKYKKCGSMTIELSLLMPGILAVFIIIIFTGYYIHDKCVIQRSLYSAAMAAGYESEDGYDPWDKFDDARKSLIGRWDFTTDEYESFGEISMHVTGSMKCFDGLFTGYLSKMAYSVDMTESAFTWSGPEYMRRHSK